MQGLFCSNVINSTPERREKKEQIKPSFSLKNPLLQGPTAVWRWQQSNTFKTERLQLLSSLPPQVNFLL